MTNARRHAGHEIDDVGAKLPTTGLGHRFTRAASAVSTWVGHPWAFS